MEDIGDYIYLIVIAIAALSSIFKKKKPAQTAPQPAEDELSDIERELQELFEEKTLVSESMNTPEPIVVPSEKMSAAPQKMVHKVFETLNDNIEQRIKKTMHPKTVTDEVDEPETEYNIQLESVEQARVAFIHSEIFNRKY